MDYFISLKGIDCDTDQFCVVTTLCELQSVNQTQATYGYIYRARSRKTNHIQVDMIQ